MKLIHIKIVLHISQEKDFETLKNEARYIIRFADGQRFDGRFDYSLIHKDEIKIDLNRDVTKIGFRVPLNMMAKWIDTGLKRNGFDFEIKYKKA